MILYVELRNNDEDIVNVSTVPQGSTYFKADLIDGVFDFNKLPGYKVEFITDYVYHITFDQAKYDKYISEQKKEQGVKEAMSKLKELTTESLLYNATDEEAQIMKYLYEPWKADVGYIAGNRRLFNDNLYKCKQNHTSQAQHTPNLVPALWDLINGDTTKGTMENPIAIPEPFSSMVYVKGKYYLEDNKLYLMNRVGMKDGEEISLTFKPSTLIGHYFKEVESSAVDPKSQETTIPDFKQPTGSHDTYKKGDQVMYNGKKYESIIDNNSYAPDAYPQGWKLLS